MAAARERHIEATPVQREHVQTARTNPELRAAANRGHPPIAATPRAGNFSNPIPARNAVMPARNTNREATPNRSDGAPARDVRSIQPNREPAPLQHANPPREIPQQRQAPQQREAPHQRQAPPPREAPPPRQAAPVEPRREPAQTQPRPAPQPQARPSPPQRPAERPAEHPQEHEHH